MIPNFESFSEYDNFLKKRIAWELFNKEFDFEKKEKRPEVLLEKRSKERFENSDLCTWNNEK